MLVGISHHHIRFSVDAAIPTQDADILVTASALHLGMVKEPGLPYRCHTGSIFHFHIINSLQGCHLPGVLPPEASR